MRFLAAHWPAVEAAERESVAAAGGGGGGGGRAAARVAYWANDYGEAEDRLGLGLATTSRAEAWEDDP